MEYADRHNRAFGPDASNLLDDGQVDRTIEILRNALREHELTVPDKLLYARCLYIKGDYAGAREILNELLAIHNDIPALFDLMAKVHEKLGLFNLSKYFESRLKESVSFMDSAREFWVSKESKAEEHKPEGKTSSREELISAIKNMLGSEAERVYPFETKTLADLFIKQGHYRKGLAVYRRLLEKETDDEKLVRRVSDLLEEKREGRISQDDIAEKPGN
ncbi:MAG: tetratricopeptide repeat protein [candidate division Zixibacteria bacterium]|nr:tetratricopeptide repeat protein [candidate division Zixibacteria bacterium]